MAQVGSKISAKLCKCDRYTGSKSAQHRQHIDWKLLDDICLSQFEVRKTQINWTNWGVGTTLCRRRFVSLANELQQSFTSAGLDGSWFAIDKHLFLMCWTLGSVPYMRWPNGRAIVLGFWVGGVLISLIAQRCFVDLPGIERWNLPSAEWNQIRDWALYIGWLQLWRVNVLWPDLSGTDSFQFQNKLNFLV